MVVRDISERKRAEKEIIALNRELEDRVARRTRQLDEAQKELVAEAHRAGMADIASNMLHNVGNILTSVTTTAHVLQDNIQNSKVGPSLNNAARLLDEHIDHLEQFLLEDPRGRRLFEFFISLDQRYSKEAKFFEENVVRLMDKIKAIQDVVVAQQSYASGVSYTESLCIATIIEDALAIESRNNRNAGVEVVLVKGEVTPTPVQKAKLIHIIINIVKNAREAMSDTPPEDKKLRIELSQEADEVIARFIDHGHGIKAEAMERIFTHGFTTKTGGHGFGLHSCAIYMEEMGGRIDCDNHADGPGAVFSLYFPIKAIAKSRQQKKTVSDRS